MLYVDLKTVPERVLHDLSEHIVDNVRNEGHLCVLVSVDDDVREGVHVNTLANIPEGIGGFTEGESRV